LIYSGNIGLVWARIEFGLMIMHSSVRVRFQTGPNHQTAIHPFAPIISTVYKASTRGPVKTDPNMPFRFGPDGFKRFGSVLSSPSWEDFFIQVVGGIGLKPHQFSPIFLKIINNFINNLKLFYIHICTNINVKISLKFIIDNCKSLSTY
jgi:hypothetical protein